MYYTLQQIYNRTDNVSQSFRVFIFCYRAGDNVSTVQRTGVKKRLKLLRLLWDILRNSQWTCPFSKGDNYFLSPYNKHFIHSITDFFQWEMITINEKNGVSQIYHFKIGVTCLFRNAKK